MSQSDTIQPYRAVEQNQKAFDSRLHEAGFPTVVIRFISQFTGFIHTRTLSDNEAREFREWAADQPAIERLKSDHDGEVYRVNI